MIFGMKAIFFPGRFKSQLLYQAELTTHPIIIISYTVSLFNETFPFEKLQWGKPWT